MWGVDFAFLSNRLRGSFDYFIKTNNGMFIDVQYPSILGAAAPKKATMVSFVPVVGNWL